MQAGRAPDPAICARAPRFGDPHSIASGLQERPRSTDVFSCRRRRKKAQIDAGLRGQEAKHFYTVICEGIDPIARRQRRRCHPAGTGPAQAICLPQGLSLTTTAATVLAGPGQPSAATRSKYVSNG
jgi:hypothetical protein